MGLSVGQIGEDTGRLSTSSSSSNPKKSSGGLFKKSAAPDKAITNPLVAGASTTAGASNDLGKINVDDDGEDEDEKKVVRPLLDKVPGDAPSPLSFLPYSSLFFLLLYLIAA